MRRRAKEPDVTRAALRKEAFDGLYGPVQRERLFPRSRSSPSCSADRGRPRRLCLSCRKGWKSDAIRQRQLSDAECKSVPMGCAGSCNVNGDLEARGDKRVRGMELIVLKARKKSTEPRRGYCTWVALCRKGARTRSERIRGVARGYRDGYEFELVLPLGLAHARVAVQDVSRCCINAGFEENADVPAFDASHCEP